jgi:hypothetical protein
LQSASNLLRGKANAVRLVHGFEHIGRQGPDFVVNCSEPFAFCAKHWITVFDNLSNHF